MTYYPLVTIKLSTFVALSKFQMHGIKTEELDMAKMVSRDGCLMIQYRRKYTIWTVHC